MFEVGKSIHFQRGPNVHLMIDMVVWCEAIQAAQSHGWQPEGTELEGYEGGWPGSYVYTARQKVSRADAESLSQALRRAVADEGFQYRWRTNLGLIDDFDGLIDFIDGDSFWICCMAECEVAELVRGSSTEPSPTGPSSVC